MLTVLSALPGHAFTAVRKKVGGTGQRVSQWEYRLYIRHNYSWIFTYESNNVFQLCHAMQICCLLACLTNLLINRPHLLKIAALVLFNLIYEVNWSSCVSWHTKAPLLTFNILSLYFVEPAEPLNVLAILKKCRFFQKASRRASGWVVWCGRGRGADWVGVQTGWPPSQPMTHVQRRRLRTGFATGEPSRTTHCSDSSVRSQN